MANIKIIRLFYNQYHADTKGLPARYYKTMQNPCRRFALVLSNSQGFGQIKGITQKKGVIYPGVEVSAFKRSDKSHLWTVRSKQDGSYAFRNIAAGLECFVVGFDPEQNYNAVISDKVVAK